MTKGVAIILMVMAHARVSKYGITFVNMFHMPLFFIMSGYCFKESHLNDFRTFSWRRVKGAYWPFVKWGLLFLLLHNFFFSINLYNDEFGYRGIVSQVYSMKDIAHHAIKIVLSMSDAEQLLGGYWFLHSYFFASFIAFAVIWVCMKKARSGLLFLCLIILLIISILSKYFNIGIPHYINAREFLSASFIIAGFLYKHYEVSWERYPLIVIPIGLVIVVLGSFLWPSSLLTFTWKNALPFVLTAIAGTLMVFSFCKIFSRYSLVSSFLEYIGNRTLAILTWHFLSFKLVSLLIICVYSLPISRLAEFPVIEEFAYHGWGVLYLITGIAVPLFIEYCLLKLHGRISYAYQHISKCHPFL